MGTSPSAVTWLANVLSLSVACFFLNSVLHRANAFTFYISFLNYSFMDNASGGMSKNSHPRSKSFSSFLLKVLQCYSFIFGSVIHFELILRCEVKSVVHFTRLIGGLVFILFFAYGHAIAPKLFIEKTILSLLSLHLCQKLTGHFQMGLFLDPTLFC